MGPNGISVLYYYTTYNGSGRIMGCCQSRTQDLKDETAPLEKGTDALHIIIISEE